MDTVPGAKTFDDLNVSQSTISRYSCRIVISRQPPYTARIYAAGFDNSKNIFLGVGASIVLEKQFFRVSYVGKIDQMEK